MAAAAASTLSLALTPCSDPSPPSHHRLCFVLSPPNHNHPFLTLHKSHRLSFKPSCTSSHSSSPAAGETSASAAYSSLEDWLKTGKFLSNEELLKLKTLQEFRYDRELESGSLWIRVMRPEEMDITVKLLSESFAESMLLPDWYLPLLSFLVKQYLIERQAVMPHAVTLLGFYRGKTAEVPAEVEKRRRRRRRWRSWQGLWRFVLIRGALMLRRLRQLLQRTLRISAT